jgi:hypothetical protein
MTLDLLPNLSNADGSVNKSVCSNVASHIIAGTTSIFSFCNPVYRIILVPSLWQLAGRFIALPPMSAAWFYGIFVIDLCRLSACIF